MPRVRGDLGGGEELSAGAAVKFQGGLADGKTAVTPNDPPEFLNYMKGERTERYRHLSRPTAKCPYHVYVPVKQEKSGDS